MLDRRATTSAFKIVSKMPARKPEEEREILKWIEDVMEEPVPKGDYEEVKKPCQASNPGEIPCTLFCNWSMLLNQGATLNQLLSR